MQPSRFEGQVKSAYLSVAEAATHPNPSYGKDLIILIHD